MTMKELRAALAKKGYTYTPGQPEYKGWAYKGVGPISPRQIATKLDMDYTTLLAVERSVEAMRK
jgi:hypothetical protein